MVVKTTIVRADTVVTDDESTIGALLEALRKRLSTSLATAFGNVDDYRNES